MEEVWGEGGKGGRGEGGNGGGMEALDTLAIQSFGFGRKVERSEIFIFAFGEDFRWGQQGGMFAVFGSGWVCRGRREEKGRAEKRKERRCGILIGKARAAGEGGGRGGRGGKGRK